MESRGPQWIPRFHISTGLYEYVGYLLRAPEQGLGQRLAGQRIDFRQARLDGVFQATDLCSVTGAGQHPPGVAGQAPFVLYRDLYRAECMEQDGSKALSVELAAEPGDQRVSPIDFDRVVFKGTTGTHIYDVHFALGDLVDLAGALLTAH